MTRPRGPVAPRAAVRAGRCAVHPVRRARRRLAAATIAAAVVATFAIAVATVAAVATAAVGAAAVGGAPRQATGATHRYKETVEVGAVPDAVTEAFAGWAEIRFAHCDLSRFDARLGVNDVRYFCFLEQIEQHPEW